MKKALQLTLTLLLCFLFVETFGQPFFGIATSVTGGTATVTTNPLTQAEELEVVTVTIADIEAGKQFLSIEVEAADLSIIPTTEITAGEEYTFEMPAQAVTVKVTLEDYVEPIVINTQPESETICEYENTILNIDAVANNGETLTYQWYFNEVAIDDATEMHIIANEAGDYHCVLSAGSAELVSDIATITVPEVNPVIEAEIGACNGTTVEINPGTFTTYLWQDMTEDAIYEATTDGIYSVTVTDENGCTAMAETNVTFFSEVTIPFEDTVNLCDGSTLLLEAPIADNYDWSTDEDTQTIEVSEEGWYALTITIATCTGSDSTYVKIVEIPEEFDLGDDITSCVDTFMLDGPNVNDVDFLWTNDETTPSIEITEDGIYGLTLINENGCERYDEIEVTFGSELEVSLHTSDTIYSCEGTLLSIEANVGSSFEWSNNLITQSINVGSNDWYCVTVTNDYECEGVDSVYAYFYDMPSINLGSDEVFCSDSELVLTAPEATEWLWSNEETVQTITITESGRYSCLITDEHGCQNSDTIRVTVHEIPTADLGEDIEVYDNDTFLLSVAAGEYEYIWSNDETSSHILVDASTLNLGDNTFSVTVTNIYGCTNSDDIIVNVSEESAVGQNIKDKITITPNPTSSIIKINANNIMNIQLFDNLGKLILSTKNDEIDMSVYPAGMYFVKISTKNDIITKKVIRQ